MSNYKQASKIGLRFQTSKGVLSLEQLWGLSVTDLSNSIKAVKKILKTTDDDDLSFLEDSKGVVDVENQLRFDILKDIYITRKEESAALRTKAADKAHNQKILELIAEKKEGDLKGLSVAELEALLK